MTRAAGHLMAVALLLGCLLGCDTAGEAAADGGGARADTGPTTLDAGPSQDLSVAEVSDLPRAERAYTASVSDGVQVVPGPGVPDDVTLQNANNNLDLVRHDGAWFLAFRTAPDHFANPDARIYVLRSDDEETWTFEAVFHEDTDLREPRLLSWDGKLFLYVALLGKSRTAFEPQGMKVSERVGTADWTPPEWSFEPGFIPWRARVVDTPGGGPLPLLMGYIGGDTIYGTEASAIRIYWLTTTDGRTWTPFLPANPYVLEGGGSEADYTFLDDGSVTAIVRNEAGDDSGFGSRICTAPADALADWDCRTDPRKYDSPAVFSHEGAVFLVGRRNVTETGHYDLGRDDLPPEEQRITYEIDYWFHPKRCALWQVFPRKREVRFLLDLPSRGDTCFPAVAPLGGADYVVYNYSSPLGGPDLVWLDGQNGPTHIHRAVVTLTLASE